MSITRMGENNSNYGNKWNDAQREYASNREKAKTNWNTEHNPSIKSPKIGKKNGRSIYEYILYKDGFFLYEGYSLTECGRLFNLKINMLTKFSIIGTKYKGYNIFRIKYR